MKRFIAALLLVAACSGGEAADDVPTVTVADVAFAPPPAWQAHDLGENARVWSPANNERKETITVIVGRPVLGGASRILAATRQAIDLLHHAQVAGEAVVSVPHGLSGKRFDLTFRPDRALDQVYTRDHVVLVVDDHPVHVFYTAREPDPDRSALSQVIASIRKAG